LKQDYSHFSTITQILLINQPLDDYDPQSKFLNISELINNKI